MESETWSSLGFFSVWLLGWTFGCFALVAGVAEAEMVTESLFMLAFSVPFLGGEVAGWQQVYSSLLERPTRPLDIDLHHDGMEVRWTQGQFHLLRAVWGGALLAIPLLAVVPALALILSTPTFAGAVLGLALLGMLGTGGLYFTRFVNHELDGFRTVRLAVRGDRLELGDGSWPVSDVTARVADGGLEVTTPDGKRFLRSLAPASQLEDVAKWIELAAVRADDEPLPEPPRALRELVSR